MKKFIIYLTISIIASSLLSAFMRLSVPYGMLNGMYTVAGVMFSVGMSIAISPKTEEVTNMHMKTAIRLSYKRIRDTFIVLFAIDTVLFILTGFDADMAVHDFLSLMCAIFTVLSIVYFIWNFIHLQKFGYDIEDQVLLEKGSN